MEINDIKIKSWYATTINHREQIKHLVSPCFIDICEYLYDLNVPICMHSGYDNQIFLVIDYDLLNEVNRHILLRIARRLPHNIKKGKYSPLDEHNEIKIVYSVKDAKNVEDIRNFFWNIAKQFKKQDVQSFIDEERFLKNVYSFPDILSRYIFCEKGNAIKIIGNKKDFKEINEIEKFLYSLGYKKIKVSEYNGGNSSYNGVCEYIWMDNDMDGSRFIDYHIYGVLIANKEALFGNKPMKIENINVNEILRVLNKSAKNYYNEEYIFNSQDKRFYLNEELLEKHNKYLQLNSKFLSR